MEKTKVRVLPSSVLDADETPGQSIALDSEKCTRTSAAGNIYDRYRDNPAALEVLKAVPANMYLGGADTVSRLKLLAKRLTSY